MHQRQVSRLSILFQFSSSLCTFLQKIYRDFQVCKEEEEAIKVDLHEGCGRTKLFWALLLADCSTLKALVEFREGARAQSSSLGVCRFCGASGSSGLLSIGNVCVSPECQVRC